MSEHRRDMQEDIGEAYARQGRDRFGNKTPDPITPKRVTLTEAERRELRCWCNSHEPMSGTLRSVPPDAVLHHQDFCPVPAVERILSDRLRAAVQDFLNDVASNHAYNGAPDPGQQFYDWGLNTWLQAIHDAPLLSGA